MEHFFQLFIAYVYFSSANTLFECTYNILGHGQKYGLNRLIIELKYDVQAQNNKNVDSSFF